jgi:hypothetical protein
MTWRVEQGDCRDIMRGLDANSVDAIVSDPPYGLAFMGKEWDHGVPGVDFWTEALRVAKPGTHLLAFGGTRTFHRLAVAIEDAGWDIRDCVMWVYGSGFPKSHNLKDEWQGWGTALKPAWEPIIVARKPLIGTVAENVLTHGTGALNIDGCRIGTGDDRVNGGASGDSAIWNGASERTQRPIGGRWPANVIHDGSEDVVAEFPNAGGGFGVRGKGGQTYADGKGFANTLGETGQTVGYGDSGSAARFFYCAKTSKAERGEGNNHPTVKPIALMRYLCRLVTPPGGLVLDPFNGSGSTGCAAVLEGFDYLGCELDEHYVNISRARIAHWQSTAEPSLGL